MNESRNTTSSSLKTLLRYSYTSMLCCVEAGINGHTDIAWKGPIEEVARFQAKEAEGLLKDLGIQVSFLLCLHVCN